MDFYRSISFCSAHRIHLMLFLFQMNRWSWYFDLIYQNVVLNGYCGSKKICHPEGFLIPRTLKNYYFRVFNFAN